MRYQAGLMRLVKSLQNVAERRNALEQIARRVSEPLCHEYHRSTNRFYGGQKSSYKRRRRSPQLGNNVPPQLLKIWARKANASTRIDEVLLGFTVDRTRDGYRGGVFAASRIRGLA